MDRSVCVHEIRNRDGVIVCSSSIPQLGYSDERLKQILADGYEYFIDGKRSASLRKKRTIR